MKVKVRIDRMVCISLASCTIMAPNIFKLDDQGKAIVDPDLATNVSEVQSVSRSEETDETGTVHYIWEIEAANDWIDKNVIPGAQSCPVTAIKVWNSETQEVIYPAS